MQFNIKLITVALLGFSSLAHLLPFTITNVGRDTAASLEEELWKRKGSGGGKGGGHSNGKGGSSSSSSRGKGSPSSSLGGATKQGSGVAPRFGGGRYYGGGATTPYASGVRSPLDITPILLRVAALTLLPGLWIYGAYSYPYTHLYSFHNYTAPTNTSDSNQNETKPVIYLCAQYQEYSCDDNGNATFLNVLIGNGSYTALN